MSNELTTSNNILSIWDDKEKLTEIRKLFAPKLTDIEFQYFIGLGKSTNLNPFLREIWAVKYGKDKDGNDNPAQVFIGRDGYRKAAQAHSEYDYHQCDAVYENDKFEVINGEVRHSYTLSNRGKLMGAYCIAKRHKASRPQYVFAELEEYSTGQSLWAEIQYKDNKYGGKYKTGGKPATMIKKVAESQCLRAAFQDLLGGTYGEEEMYEKANGIETKNINAIQGDTQTERLKNTLKSNIIDIETGEITDIDDTEVTQQPPKRVHNTGSDDILINEDQLNMIEISMDEKGFSDDRKKKALDYFKVSALTELTDAQARIFLIQLDKA